MYCARHLKALGKITFPGASTGLAFPGLIDQSTTEDGFGENYFIVIERAGGFDLKSLAQVTHFGLLEHFRTGDNFAYLDFLQSMAKFSQLPDQLLIRSLLAAWRPPDG